MKLSENESELIKVYRKAKQDNDTNMLISIYALINILLEEQDSKPRCPLSEFTKEQYKRAIRALRAAQVWALHNNRPDATEYYDRSVRYIREHCLQLTAAA